MLQIDRMLLLGKINSLHICFVQYVGFLVLWEQGYLAVGSKICGESVGHYL